MTTAAPLTAENTKRIVKTKEWDVEIYEAGQGHPVIMLHGTGPGATGWSNFYPNIGPLSEKYHAIALTFPGWGDSSEFDPTKESRTKANARAVKLVMDELGLEKAALVGNSMGGMCVQQFAVDYPERLSHFITMGAPAPGPNAFQVGGWSEGMQVLRETYADPSPSNFRDLVRVMVYDSSFVTDSLVQARSDAALKNKTHLENWLKPNMGGLPSALADDLAKVQTPALIIQGRDDRTVPMEGSLRLVSMLPNSTLVVYNHCGHWAQIEHADEFNKLIDLFISTH
jgi:2-hydroxy-6-oxonona-2,4-dienedioate hydrolase